MKGLSRVAGRVRALVLVSLCCPSGFVLAEDPAAVSSVAAPSPEVAVSTAAPTPPSTPTVPAGVSADLPSSPDELVVRGRRSRTEAQRDRTASATVVSADQFAGEAKGVAELVATAPGVAVNDYGGLGRLATASIRGSTADGVLVLLDGIPLNSAFGGGVDLSSIPRAWIDRIEIVRGVEGAQYGAGALGGVVNVVTRKPTPGTWSAEGLVGSFGTAGGSGDGAISVGDGALLLSAGLDATRGRFPYEWDRQSTVGSVPLDYTRLHNGSARGGALAKLSLPLGDARLDAVLEASGGRRELPTDPSFDADGSGDWQQDARGLLAVRAVVPGPVDALSFAPRAGLRLDSYDTRLTSLGGIVRRQRGGLASTGAEALLSHPLGLLRAEATAESEWLDADTAEGARSRARLAAALTEDLRLAGGRIRVAPAVRVDRIGTFSGASGKLGASAAIAGPLSVRASAGQSFRAPSFSELYLQQGLAQPNPDLTSERGTGGDAALVAQGWAGMASVGGNATLYRDLIVWQPASFGRLKPFNTGKAFLGGVEAEAATAPLRQAAGLSLSAAYTWLRSENLRGTEDVAGNDLPRRPRHRAYARAAVTPGPFTAHVEAQYVGAQWEDTRNVYRIPATTLWNAGASVAVNPTRTLAVTLEVKNALDDRTLLDPIGNPLPGRMVLVTLRGGSTRAEVMP